jgi:hypothetical protein
MNAKLPSNFDPNDPNSGSAHRSDVVRDVTDFRPSRRSRKTSKDRIKGLEDRLTKLENNVEIGSTFTNSHAAVLKKLNDRIAWLEMKIVQLESVRIQLVPYYQPYYPPQTYPPVPPLGPPWNPDPLQPTIWW